MFVNYSFFPFLHHLHPIHHINKRPESGGSGGNPHNPIKSTCYNESLSSEMSESKNTYCDGVVERFSIETDFLNILVGDGGETGGANENGSSYEHEFDYVMIDSYLKAKYNLWRTGKRILVSFLLLLQLH
jgi:hypothetical protein